MIKHGLMTFNGQQWLTMINMTGCLKIKHELSDAIIFNIEYYSISHFMVNSGIACVEIWRHGSQGGRQWKLLPQKRLAPEDLTETNVTWQSHQTWRLVRGCTARCMWVTPCTPGSGIQGGLQGGVQGELTHRIQIQIMFFDVLYYCISEDMVLVLLCLSSICFGKFELPSQTSKVCRSTEEKNTPQSTYIMLYGSQNILDAFLPKKAHITYLLIYISRTLAWVDDGWGWKWVCCCLQTVSPNTSNVF